MYTQREIELAHFIEYCHDFYGPEGIYDLNANRDQIAWAIVRCERNGWSAPFEGDSLNREQVRTILEHHFGLSEVGQQVVH